MRKILLTLLAIVLILGALGAAGMTGYRFGYAQGIQSAASQAGAQPQVPGFGLGPQQMPMHNFGFERGSGRDRSFGPDRFPMMGRGGMGFGFFSPLMFLVQIAFWVLVIWAIYALITRSGWRLTRTPATTAVPPAPTETEVKE